MLVELTLGPRSLAVGQGCAWIHGSEAGTCGQQFAGPGQTPVPGSSYRASALSPAHWDPLWAPASLSVQRQTQKRSRGVDGEQEGGPPSFPSPGGVFTKSHAALISRNCRIRRMWGNKSGGSFGQGLMWGDKQEEACSVSPEGKGRKDLSPLRTGAAARQTAPHPTVPGLACAEPSVIILTGGQGGGITHLWVQSENLRWDKICPRS